MVRRDMRPAQAQAWFTLGVLLIMYVLSLIDRQIIALMVTPLRRDLGLNDVQIGLLEGLAFVVMYTCAAIPLGWAIDRLSRRMVVFAGVMCWSLSCMMAGFASSMAGLFASRVGVGLGEASLSPASQSMLSNLFPRESLSLALAVFAVGANLGVMISYGVGGLVIHALQEGGDISLPLVGQVHPWQAAFMIAGAPGIVLAFLMFLVPEPPRVVAKAKTERFFAPLVGFIRERPLALATIILGFSLNNMLGYSILGWAPVFLERRFGWEVREIGPTLGLLLGITGVVGTLSAGFLANWQYRRGRHEISYLMGIGAFLLIAPLACLAFLSPSPYFCLAALGATYLLASSLIPSAFAALQLIAPDELRGRLSGVHLCVSNLIGQGLGPAVVGFTTEYVFSDPAKVGHSLAFVVSCAAAIGAALLFVGLGSFKAALKAAVARGPALARLDGRDGARGAHLARPSP